MTQMIRARVATNFCLTAHWVNQIKMTQEDDAEEVKTTWVESRVLPTIPANIIRPQIPPSQLIVWITARKMWSAFGTTLLNSMLNLPHIYV